MDPDKAAAAATKRAATLAAKKKATKKVYDLSKFTNERDEAFRTKCGEFFNKLHEHPESLEKDHPAMKTELDTMKHNAINEGEEEEEDVPEGQGSANKASSQEACFAVEARDTGFKFLRPGVTPTDGLWFAYQLGGSQAKLDFQLLSVSGDKIDKVNVDLKHSNNTTIKLNDGWFWEDTIYIISFTRGPGRKKGGAKKQVCLVANGSDIATPERTAMRTTFVEAMNKIKTEFKGDGIYKPYPRKADSYSCNEFTDEFVKDRLTKTLAWLAPTVPAPHSPPA